MADLGDTVGVLLDYAVGRVNYGRSRAVVAFKAENLGFREVLGEVEDILDLRSAEGVNRLRVISHHADIATQLRELLHYDVLRIVGILVLVHEYVGEAAGQGVHSLGVVPQKYVHIDKDVVEIHHSGLLELALVEAVNLVQLGLVAAGIRGQQVLTAAVGLRRHQIVLRPGNAGEHILWLISLVVKAELLDAMLHCGSGVGGVVNGKLGRITQKLGPLAKEAHEHGVESPHHHATGLRPADKQGNSLLHFISSLLGKSKSQNS